MSECQSLVPQGDGEIRNDRFTSTANGQTVSLRVQEEIFHGLTGLEHKGGWLGCSVRVLDPPGLVRGLERDHTSESSQ